MLLLHGSATGTATDVASSLFRLSRRYEVQDLVLASLEDFDLVRLLEFEIAVFVVSTTGNGDIPASMHRFWSTLLRDDIGSDILDELNFVIIGLGDSKYAQFNWTAKKLRRRLLQLGAHEAMELVMCDDSAHEGLDTAFIPFTKLFDTFLKQVSGKEKPIPKDIVLPPVCPIRFVDANATGTFQHNQEELTTRLRARMKESRRLTPDTREQDVRLLTFVVDTDPDQTIDPGDVLSLFPANSEDAVDRFLLLLNWHNDADRPIQLPEGSKTSRLFDTSANLTLRDFVQRAIPIYGIPSLSLFSQLQQFTTNTDFKEKFEEWDEPDGKDDLYDYLTRPRRSLLEVIEDFAGGLNIPIEHCVDLFGTTVSRSYSIAGARPVPRASTIRNTDDVASTKFEVDLLVAMVKYQTKIKEPRQGLASRYLSALQPCDGCDDDSSALLITIDKPIIKSNQMPIPPVSVPLLMICTGTGFAPLRFFIDRLFQDVNLNKTTIKHDVTVFFGCRTPEDDLVSLTLPQELLNQVRVVHAYSRLEDQPRTYVQDLVPRHAAEIQNIVKHGRVYLCGSSGAMPDAVRLAIDRLTGPGSVENMADSGRWWQETW